MSAIVQFKSEVSGQHHPTPAQRAKAMESISALYRARREGILKNYMKSISVSEQNSPKRAQKSAPISAQSSNITVTDIEKGIKSGSPDSINAENFLRLLVMQMQYQDPLNPVENTDMLAQLAQFSVLEQSIQMNEKVESLQKQLTDLTSSFQIVAINTAQQLIGKTVEGSSITGKPVQGVVESVSIQDGMVLLHVGDSILPLSNVQKIQGVQQIIR